MAIEPTDQKNLSAIRRMSQAYIDKRHDLLSAGTALNYSGQSHHESDACMVAAVRELQQIVFERGRGAKRPALEQEVAELIKEHERES